MYFKESHVEISKLSCISVPEVVLIFNLENSADPDEIVHFIWVFTVCKSIHLGDTHIQRVKELSH